MGQPGDPDTLHRVNPEELDALRTGRTAVSAAFAGITGDDLSRRPAAEAWSAWEVAYHLFDIERWYIAKLCEAVSNDKSEALHQYLAIWGRLRDEAIQLATRIPDHRVDQPALLSGIPDWTPRGLLQAMTAHDHEHAAQVLAARGDRNMIPPLKPILHIATAEAWGEARTAGWYRGDTLDSEGFIHCSTPAQVLGVANLLFRGQSDLVLLVIDPARLSAPLRYEGAEGGRLFPHIYGPLETAAVTTVLAFEPGSDGSFTLPPELGGVISSPGKDNPT